MPGLYLDPFAYIKTSLLSFALIWIITVAWQNYKTGKLKVRGFRFNIKNYYLFIAGFGVYPVVHAMSTNTLAPIFIFLVLGFAGMLFEILCSESWNMFFKKPFYAYTVKTIDRGSSSWLNILPWGGGAMLLLAIVMWLTPLVNYFNVGASSALAQSGSIPFYYVFIIVFLSCLVLQMLLWVTFILQKRHNHRFTKLTWKNFVFYTFPFWVALAACAAIYGPLFIWIALIFGLLSAAIEYLFGKASQWIISKKLWTYNHFAFDRGHFTPVAIAGFAGAGFYFWGLSLILQQFIK